MDLSVKSVNKLNFFIYEISTSNASIENLECLLFLPEKKKCGSSKVTVNKTEERFTCNKFFITLRVYMISIEE